MCTHIWITDSRDQGVCKLCRETKDFRELLFKEKVYQRGIGSRIHSQGYEYMGYWGKNKYEYPVQGTIGKPIGGYGIYDDS